MAAEDCLQAIRLAAGRELSDDEAIAIFARAQARVKALKAAGTIDNLTERVAEIARAEGDRERLAAAKARQHAARNAIVRDALDGAIDRGLEAGLSHKQVMLALLEGTSRGVAGGRVSVAATKLAYQARFAWDMLAQIQRERPHLFDRRALADKRLSDDALREMRELREGGTPGVTGNPDAQYLAKVFTSFAELSRQDLNRLGAAIGKLDGWSPQVHDPHKLLRTTREDWAAEMEQRLDFERTMPELAPEMRRAELGRIYDTIVTGISNRSTARGRGEFAGPSNIANRLGAERILHFRSAEDAIAYNDRFGFGNLFTAMWKHQEQASRYAGQMHVFGPNPELMMGSLLDSLEKRIKADPGMTAQQKAAAARSLTIEGNGTLASAWSVMTGFHLIPANLRAAEIGSAVRAVEAMAKLGGAVISSVSDLVTAAVNLGFHGNRTYLGALAEQTGRLIAEGRGSGNMREWAVALGEGADGIIGHLNASHFAEDSTPGRFARALDAFHRWNGLTWWTEANRAVTVRMMSREMGENAAKAWGELPARYHHVLGLHDIGERQWEALRQAKFKVEENGHAYVTPDRVRDLGDDVIGGLVDGEASPGRIADARRDLELAVRRFFADEARFGVLETDAAAQRIMTGGLQRGSFFGEAARFVMQFKGFPTAFAQRVVGRALHGAEDMGNAGAAHIGTLILGSTAAGYLAMTAKDAIANRTPRPLDREHAWKTLLAALVQGGGAGIYGDFLFGESQRFGGGLADTVLGPALGSATTFGDIWRRAIRGDASAGDVLNAGLTNTPYLNLFYLRPALNALVINSMHEWASPGWGARQRSKRLRDYGQRPLFQ